MPLEGVLASVQGADEVVCNEDEPVQGSVAAVASGAKWIANQKVWQRLSGADRMQATVFAVEWRNSIMVEKDEFASWLEEVTSVQRGICGYMVGMSQAATQVADYIAVVSYGENRFKARSVRRAFGARHESLKMREEFEVGSSLSLRVFVPVRGFERQFKKHFVKKCKVCDEFLEVRPEVFDMKFSSQ